MKLSLCQMIAIISILAVGFMTAAPFVQTTEAHGPQHAYNAIVEEVKDVWCAGCGVYMGYTVIRRYNTIAIHADNMPHRNFRIWIGNTQSVCFACMLEDT